MTRRQLTGEDVTRLYARGRYDLIEQARVDGRLAVLLGGQPPADDGTDEPEPAQLSRSEVERLAREGRHDVIEQARRDGQLAELLGHDTI